jgi:hypothetical protein
MQYVADDVKPPGSIVGVHMVRWMVVGMTWVGLILAAQGCAKLNYEAHMLDQQPIQGKELPKIVIDKKASLVALQANMPDKLLDKKEILDAIEKYWNRNATGDAPLPARVAVSGQILTGGAQVAFMIVGFELTAGTAFLFGMPTGSGEASVNVTVEIKGRPQTYTGFGDGDCLSWIYAPRDYEQCAFARAVTAAIRTATFE